MPRLHLLILVLCIYVEYIVVRTYQKKKKSCSQSEYVSLHLPVIIVNVMHLIIYLQMSDPAFFLF